MVIADYKGVKISSFLFLVVKLWLKEDSGLHSNRP